MSGIFAHRRIEAAGRYYKEKRIYESFTSDIPGPKGKRMAEKMAAEFAVRKEQLSRETPDLTLGEAMDNYINSRKAVLSPRTIMDYERMRSKDFLALVDVKINHITQQQIQSAINLLSVNHSPKTVRNAHGFLVAVLKQFRPDFAVTTSLPQKYVPIYMYRQIQISESCLTMLLIPKWNCLSYWLLSAL